MWSGKPMWNCKYSTILESKVKFDKTYMKMSKYKKSVFPYSVHYTPNLSAWRPKDTNVTIMPFSRLFTPRLFTFSRQLLPKEFFFQILSKLTIFVRNCQHPILWRIYQNWNLSFCNLKYEPRINENNSMRRSKTNFLYFYVLKELSPKVFYKFLAIGNSKEDQAKYK